MKPTVVHVLEAFAGGTERHLLDLVEHVTTVEHVLAVPSLHLGGATQEAADRARELGARVELVEMTRVPAPRRNAAAVAALRALLRWLRPAVLHGHSSIGGAVSRLAAIRTGIPVVYTPNGLSRSRWALAVERLLRDETDRFIAVSRSEAEFAIRKRLTSLGRLEVIPNGIELEPAAPISPSLRERLGIPRETPLVGCLGRLTWQKAPEIYVNACAVAGARHPSAHFVLVGTGPHRAGVQRALRAARLRGRFHWLDALPGAAGAFAELDLYVLPSRFEGGPYTPLEAMRAQTTVILTDADGNRDTVEHGVTGLLVPVDDATALGGAIAELLIDDERRRALARAGRERLVRHFDVRAMGEATSRVYDTLVAAHVSPASVARPGQDVTVD